MDAGGLEDSDAERTEAYDEVKRKINSWYR